MSKAGASFDNLPSKLWSSRGAAAVPPRAANRLSPASATIIIRQNQTDRYPENFGQLGADYIAKQWSTTDYWRIDRLTQDAYAKGYFKPADFEGLAAKLIATVVKNERVTGNACAG